MGNLFFTADLHFEHKKILDFCPQRPWRTVAEMNEGLIARWNERVGADDSVIVLGDFAFCGTGRIREILARLNGHKTLVLGNHDWKHTVTKWKDMGFADACKGTASASADGTHVRLCHFPYMFTHPTDTRYEEQKPVDKGDFLLHGHVHQTWKRKGRMLNVGVDVWNCYPVSQQEVARELKKQDPQQWLD